MSLFSKTFSPILWPRTCQWVPSSSNQTYVTSQRVPTLDFTVSRRQLPHVAPSSQLLLRTPGFHPTLLNTKLRDRTLKWSSSAFSLFVLLLFSPTPPPPPHPSSHPTHLSHLCNEGVTEEWKRQPNSALFLVNSVLIAAVILTLHDVSPRGSIKPLWVLFAELDCHFSL